MSFIINYSLVKSVRQSQHLTAVLTLTFYMLYIPIYIYLYIDHNFATGRMITGRLVDDMTAIYGWWMSEKGIIIFWISFHKRRLPATNLFHLSLSFNSVYFVCSPHNTGVIIITHKICVLIIISQGRCRYTGILFLTWVETPMKELTARV